MIRNSYKLSNSWVQQRKFPWQKFNYRQKNSHFLIMRNTSTVLLYAHILHLLFLLIVQGQTQAVHWAVRSGVARPWFTVYTVADSPWCIKSVDKLFLLKTSSRLLTSSLPRLTSDQIFLHRQAGKIKRAPAGTNMQRWDTFIYFKTLLHKIKIRWQTKIQSITATPL